jgi:hypothetical protein
LVLSKIGGGPHIAGKAAAIKHLQSKPIPLLRLAFNLSGEHGRIIT